MALKAGHCSDCGRPVWRTAEAQKDHDGTAAGTVFLLWPIPTSVYARLETPTGFAPGIAYCGHCAPEEGTQGPVEGLGKILAYETAHERYGAWFSEPMREFYEAWLRDHLMLGDQEIRDLLRQWDIDRAWRVKRRVTHD